MDTGEYDAEASLAELYELVRSAGAEAFGAMTQKRPAPDTATCVGSGMMEEIAQFCEKYEIDLLIFDRELSPTQIRNIEEEAKVRVIDRTMPVSYTHLDVYKRQVYGELLELWSKVAPYELNTMLASTATMKDLMAIQELQDATAGLNFQGTGKMITPLGANLVHTPSLKDKTIIGLDKNCTLEMVQAGGIVLDYDRLIDRQMERAAISTKMCIRDRGNPHGAPKLDPYSGDWTMDAFDPSQRQRLPPNRRRKAGGTPVPLSMRDGNVRRYSDRNCAARVRRASTRQVH